ncbi:MAG: DUF1350 family protein [Gloeocapsa sp. UFS-A4-WI-NPMV-4B04]|jgi:hypothetical protein|nr:DUF1350 family protein [Gloeocapsa sp. UFS-A4-WI-NPMV-4B04]
MSTIFKPIAHSWIAIHSEPIGIVEFIGGALFGSVPIVSYDYFLRSLYEAGYTIIALPFRFGLDHQYIAETLLAERDDVFKHIADSHQGLPRFWVGHSLGCKYIVLLEAASKIWDQPSLLIAPDISDTKDAVPLPLVPELLDKIGGGVKPTRKEIQTIIKKSNLFNLTALISFDKDKVAGTASEPVEESDVALFIHEIEAKKNRKLLKNEIPGKHEEIVGLKVHNFDGSVSFVDIDLSDGIFENVKQRQLEPLAVDFLKKLGDKLK